MQDIVEGQNYVPYSDSQGVEHMKLETDVKPITYLKNNTADLVRHVKKTGRSVIITQNGEAKVVVMDVERYDQLRQSLLLLKIVAHGEEDIDSGRTLDQDEAFDRAEKVLRDL